MYGMRPLPYMMTEPISAQPIMYASGHVVSTQVAWRSLQNIQCNVMKLACGLSALSHDGVYFCRHETKVNQGPNMIACGRWGSVGGTKGGGLE